MSDETRTETCVIPAPWGWEGATEGECHFRRGYKYHLARPMRTRTKLRPEKRIETEWIRLDVDGWLTLRAGFAWNGASGPTIDTKSSIRSSGFHDAGCQLIALGLLAGTQCRAIVDQMLVEVSLADGMWPPRARAWGQAVAHFGGDYSSSAVKVEIAP